MAYGVRLHVWGERALFTRPEMKVERVSYDVMTPSAARGILEAIHWKPAIRWVIDRIRVLRPIRFESLRRNELSDRGSSDAAMTGMKRGRIDGLGLIIEERLTPRAATLLRDVGYVIEAHFEMTRQAGLDDNEGKHLDIFNRRARQGQTYHQPYLGTREFPVHFCLLESSAQEPSPHPQAPRDMDLGWMLYDMDHKSTGIDPLFFRGRIDDQGWIDLRDIGSREMAQ
ncbi:MAG: type I-C CRISPR-associated protein Cas5c [Magnetococcus sp. WYHC-3]